MQPLEPVEEPDYETTFKLGFRKGSQSKVSTIMLYLINKIIVQNIGAKSELSTRIYKPMMAIDDEVEAN